MFGLALAALVLGLFGSVHCVAMCGGIATVLAGGVQPNLRKGGATRLPILAGFHVGRIATYAALGAVVGALSLFAIEGAALQTARAVLRALSGVLLVGVGLYLAGMFPGFAVIERVGAPLWRKLRPVAGKLLPVQNARSAILLGAIWGVVPCGMVYTALALGATSGGPVRGALVLTAFGLGTTPALLSLGAFAQRLADRLRASAGATLRRFAGVVVASLGVMSVIAGVLAMPSEGRAASDVHCAGHDGARASGR